MLLQERSVGLRQIITVGIIVMLLLWFVALAFGQNTIPRDLIIESEIEELETSPVSQPVFSDYKGIVIGTTEAELRARIDTKPAFESNDDYVYVFSDAESAQFLLDADRKVKVMSITYSGHDANAPSYEHVFGKNVAMKMTADGNVYNLVNYANAGFLGCVLQIVCNSVSNYHDSKTVKWLMAKSQCA